MPAAPAPVRRNLCFPHGLLLAPLVPSTICDQQQPNSSRTLLGLITRNQSEKFCADSHDDALFIVSALLNCVKHNSIRANLTKTHDSEKLEALKLGSPVDAWYGNFGFETPEDTVLATLVAMLTLSPPYPLFYSPSLKMATLPFFQGLMHQDSLSPCDFSRAFRTTSTSPKIDALSGQPPAVG
ncbi:hypothetical protein C8J57DRAFT_1730848 [Mycena rebaudengoi]|nr:hypothetical protein C8J57DRAFT_1730848 [Mycena rebaudengoi]